MTLVSGYVQIRSYFLTESWLFTIQTLFSAAAAEGEPKMKKRSVQSRNGKKSKSGDQDQSDLRPDGKS